LETDRPFYANTVQPYAPQRFVGPSVTTIKFLHAPTRPAGRYQPDKIVGDEADAVSVDQRQNLFVVPAAVAELDDLLEIGRKAPE